MPKSEILEQFQAIGYSMAKKAKSEVQEINQIKLKKVKELNLEFTKNLMRDLKNKTESFLRNYETQLNQQISENIKDLNLKVLAKKNAMFDDFKISLMDVIQTRIKDNYDSYIQKIISQIKESLRIFKSASYIQLNLIDKETFNRIQAEVGDKKILLEPKPLESIGGYKLSNRTNTVVISNTIEDSLQKNLNLLRMKFAKIFPEYSDRRKSATELMKERNISISSSLPEELQDYMLEHNIEYSER